MRFEKVCYFHRWHRCFSSYFSEVRPEVNACWWSLSRNRPPEDGTRQDDAARHILSHHQMNLQPWPLCPSKYALHAVVAGARGGVPYNQSCTLSHNRAEHNHGHACVLRKQRSFRSFWGIAEIYQEICTSQGPSIANFERSAFLPPMHQGQHGNSGVTGALVSLLARAPTLVEVSVARFHLQHHGQIALPLQTRLRLRKQAVRAQSHHGVPCVHESVLQSLPFHHHQ